MYKPPLLFKNIIQSTNSRVLKKSLSNYSHPTKLNLRKVLVLTKLSLYECERNKHKTLTDEQFENELRKNGFNFDRLSYFYHLHKDFELKVIKNFKAVATDVRVVNRMNYSNEAVEWADVVIPTGGDGTFLLAASKIKDNKTAVIGFNSDPTRSEGHLCLPKHYSENISDALEMLKKGQYSWLLRTRIGMKLLGQTCPVIPTHLHVYDKNCNYEPFTKEHELNQSNEYILPYLALNEVFIGECLSARVSYLEVTVNGNERPTNMKCSGLCVTTGTGSTSWHLSMNRVTTECAADLISLIKTDSNANIQELAESVSNEYNKKLIFEPGDTRLSYTIRDLISAAVWPQPKGIRSRDFCKSITIKSKCIDPCLVIDGGVSLQISNGATLILTTNPQDTLRTVILPD